MLYWFLIFIILFFQLVLLVALLFLLSTIVTAIFTIPWVPTRGRVAKSMFELAGLKPGETVVDFGCGDGSLLFVAVKDFGAAKGIGFEIHPGIRWLGLIRAKLLGISDKIDLRGGSFFKVKFPPADVVACYLFPETQAKLEPLLKAAYPSGTRVIARTFRYPTLPLEKTLEVNGERFYLYRLP